MCGAEGAACAGGAVTKHLTRCATVDELHNEVQLVALRIVNHFEELDDVGVVQPAGKKATIERRASQASRRWRPCDQMKSMRAGPSAALAALTTAWPERAGRARLRPAALLLHDRNLAQHAVERGSLAHSLPLEDRAA